MPPLSSCLQSPQGIQRDTDYPIFPFPPQPSIIVSCPQTFIETACVKLINGFLFSRVNSYPVLKWFPFPNFLLYSNGAPTGFNSISGHFFCLHLHTHSAFTHFPSFSIYTFPKSRLLEFNYHLYDDNFLVFSLVQTYWSSLSFLSPEFPCLDVWHGASTMWQTAVSPFVCYPANSCQPSLQWYGAMW